MRKIKVMHLIWQLSTGGGEKVLLNILEHFKDDPSIEVKAFTFYAYACRPYEEMAKSKELDVTYIDGYKGENYIFPLNKIYLHFTKTKQRHAWLGKQIAAYQPDIIHVHVSNLAFELYKELNRHSSNCYIIYHMHSMPEAIKKERQFIIKKALKEGCYHPIGVTRQQIQSAKNIYCYEQDIPLIYNGIDEAVYMNHPMRNDQKAKDKLRAEFGLSSNDFVIGCVGRMNLIKNHKLLIEALKYIRNEIPEAKLMLVGQDQGNLQQELKQLAGEHSDSIIFTGNRSDIADIFQIFNVFALASFYESSSLVTVEAQLSRIPCVISDAVSDETIITDAVKKLSPNGTPQEWAVEIVKMRGKEVHILDEDRFDINKCMQDLKKIYTSIGCR